MALVLFIRFFNKFNSLSISASGLHAIMIYEIGCIKYAIHVEDDDRIDTVILRLADLSLPDSYAESIASQIAKCTINRF